jgi:cytochrome c2
MVQHEILMLVAAPLLVLGRPLIPCIWGLPFSWRRRLGRAVRPGWIQGGWHTLTNPLLAWSLHAVALWIWHTPGLFQAALETAWVHVLQHLSFLGSALLFWWALTEGRRGPLGYGAAVFWVFATSVHSSILGALFTFAPSSWYPAYTETTALWGLTPLEDQQLGGLIMWVPAGMIYVLAGLALCAGWLRESEWRALPRQGQSWPQRRSVESEPMRDKHAVEGAVKRMLLCGLVIIFAELSACNRNVTREAAELTGGDPARGRVAIRHYGCPSCHTIPGVPGAYGLVGPPLGGIANRVYIAGMLPNTPDNMIRWIQAPQEVHEHTAMPNMGMTEAEARDIAGYLYTLK